MWRLYLRPRLPRKLTAHQAAAWRRSFDALLAFVEREGHAKVPYKHHEGERALGSWVRRQRAKWREGKLLEEHRELLENLPDWDFGREGPAQMPVEDDPRHGGHEFNFIVSGDGWRLFVVWGEMVGLGATPRSEAVVEMTKRALQNEFTPKRHLREDGRMAWLLNRAFDDGLRKGKFDEPRPGYVRAVIRKASKLSLEDWMLCIDAAKIDTPVPWRKVVDLAVEQAVEILGLRPASARNLEALDSLYQAIDQLVESGKIELLD